MSRLGRLAPVLILVLVACGGAESGSSTGPLRVQVSGEREEVAVYQALVEQFEEARGIDVQLIEAGDKDDHLAKLTTSFAGGVPPDVFLVNYREYSQFVVRDAIDPVGPLLEEAGVDLDAYFPQPLEAFTFDDALQCMPQNISSLVVYYNKELFRHAGLRPPRAGWDWEGLRLGAAALTRGDVHGLGIEPSLIRIAPFVWSNGGEIVDDPTAPTRLTLDGPEAREALEFIVSLVREDGVVPGETDVAAEDLETRFITGKLGMLLSSRKDTPVFREVRGLRWDVLPLPQSVQPAGILHSDAYCIANGSAKTADALEFVRFATGREGETITALGGRTVPSLKEVARSGAFLDPSQPPRHSEVFLETIPHIRRTPVIPTWPEIEDIAEEILTRAFYEEGYTIDDALRDLDEQTTPLFEEALP